MNIYEKMAHARCELKSKEMKKSGKNPFAKFTYFELSDFIPYVLDILEKYKICSKFSLNNQEARLEFINAEMPEETIDYSAPIAQVDLKGCTAIQGIGASITYMRRYLYMMAFEIVEADMLDAVVSKDEQPTFKKRIPKYDPQDLSDAEEALNNVTLRPKFDVIINKIKDIDTLNDAYTQLKSCADNDWKRPLANMAEKLGCVFNKEKNMFLIA